MEDAGLEADAGPNNNNNRYFYRALSDTQSALQLK